ncbi:MAG: hypothetical protein KKE02_18760 [Alphaproteobacteria bacterium]|nr:hypothetical protein [Alphaproteobacteria bacterium]MBU1514327.1 hypothetical protein [Alphaproteobacteria bacterium]MBU2095971.1 hypothetical protein [Alphaproteobacteria bacterium]MBU2153069.1 hypothetical protein [Alphaproteobacteria bacterium]MBU2308526.1 hypothetical protein [Alphaproteobacteria bacterium]
MRSLLCGAALSLAFGLAAQAQVPGQAAPGTVNPPVSNPPAASPSAAAAPAASDASATVSPYKVGMTIKDAQGGAVGTIARVIRTPDGATTISASVDGRNVNLPASALTLSADGGAVSSMSKAQITASTVPPT